MKNIFCRILLVALWVSCIHIIPLKSESERVARLYKQMIAEK